MNKQYKNATTKRQPDKNGIQIFITHNLNFLTLQLLLNLEDKGLSQKINLIYPFTNKAS